MTATRGATVRMAEPQGRSTRIAVEIPGVEVQGTLDLQQWFGTLGAILSQKFGVDITAKSITPARERRTVQEERDA